MLNGKRLVVISGASGGLGLAIAKSFAHSGWKVAGTGRSLKPPDFPENGEYSQFDASDAAACAGFWTKLMSGHDDAMVCLVNNAGGYVSGGLLETSPEDYEGQMRSSYFTSVYMTRAMAGLVKSGRIINVVSTSALEPQVGDSAYGSAKAAQMHFFQSLQQEFGADKYQITNLYPSDIASRGPNPNAIDPGELADYIRGLAEARGSYYLRDVTIYPR